VATDPVPDGPWDTTDPRRDRSITPYTDADTQDLIDEIVDTLTIIRCPMGLGDGGATLSVLASLAAEIASRLPDAVADARDHSYTWNEIAMRLSATIPAARRRYATHTRSRHELPCSPVNRDTSNTRVSDVGRPRPGEKPRP